MTQQHPPARRPEPDGAPVAVPNAPRRAGRAPVPRQPATLATRESVRAALASIGAGAGAGADADADAALGVGVGADASTARRTAGAEAPLALVGLSGGADSLALAAALAFEAPRRGMRCGAIVVDHDLQPGSGAVAARAAEQARELGLDPVSVERVVVPSGGSAAPGSDRSPRGGPEARARRARYGAFARAAGELGAVAVLTAHTRDDQAEQVLLALARGSGTRSLAGIPERRALGEGTTILRPFLGGRPEITRSVTETACAEQGLDPWRDPQNSDPVYTRVRVRERLLPMLEAELGPGASAGLARTADLAREDADALDGIAAVRLSEVLAAAERDDDRVAIPVAAIAHDVPAVRNRMIRRLALREFGAHLHRRHTEEIVRLVGDWRGQGPVFVPGMRVARQADVLQFARHPGAPLR